MAHAGDTYTIPLGDAPRQWGEHRNPTNRRPVEGEGYIPIPKHCAEQFCVYNSNHIPSGMGYNLFIANSTDGFLHGVELLAQGSSRAGDIYAKQFSVRGNLKTLGDWYRQRNVGNNNSVRVTWQSDTEILLEII